MNSDNQVYRKQQLRERGLIEIPMSFDPSRYFIGNIRWMDIVYTAPFIVLSVITIVILQRTGNLNTSTFLFSFLPATLVLTMFWVKHPDRKNISFVTTLWWRLKYVFSKKTFEYTKERKENMQEDIRSQLGIYNIVNDCFETLDNNLIKVVTVSSVNLTGMSLRDRDKVYASYQSFLNNYSYTAFPIQINQFSKPINLRNYIGWVNKETSGSESFVKRMLAESYIEKTNEIQKSKNMVSKARYIIISEKIGTNKEKSLQKISEEAERMVSGVENILSGKFRLKAQTLNNEELFEFIYSSIDYENAQISQSIQKKNNINTPFSFGKESYVDMQSTNVEEFM